MSNSREPLKPYEATSHIESVRSTRFVVPLMFCGIHTLAMLWFASANPALAGPEADAAAMVWILWVWIDFPLGFAGLLLSAYATTNAGAVLCMLIFGGLQWALWGWILEKVFRR